MTGAREGPITVAVIGVGRIGRLHAHVVARRVQGAQLGPVYDVHSPLAADVAAEFGVPHAGSVEAILSSDVDAVAICSSSGTHVDLMIAAAEAGKAIFCEKPISLELGEVDRGLDAVQRAGVPVPGRLQPPLRSGACLGRRGGRGRAGRRAAPRADLKPRSGAAAARVRPRLRRAVSRHDDPRLRHGSVRHRQRGRRGVRARDGPDRFPPRRDRRRRHGARHARAREWLLHRDRQLPPGGLRLRSAGRGVRFGGDGRVGESHCPHRCRRRSERHRRARRCRTSSSSVTWRATSWSGRRSSTRSPRARPRPSAPRTRERRSPSASRRGNRCGRAGRSRSP